MARPPRLVRWLRRLAIPLIALGLILGTPGPAIAGGHHGHHGHHGPVSTDIIDSARGGGRVVSLTFDDGPNPADTPELLGVLRKHHVKAVFCLWGDHVNEHPEIVRMIVRHGHTLCNHSMHHDNMGTWTQEQIEADLVETQAAIRRAAPHARIPYFRAPFGSWGETPVVAARLGMRSLGWSLAVEDWVPPGTDVLVQRLTDGINPDTVVLLHDGGGDRSQTVEAVDRIIPTLRAEGWRFALPAGHGWPGRGWPGPGWPGHGWPGPNWPGYGWPWRG